MALIVLALTASLVVLANSELYGGSWCQIKTCGDPSRHTLCQYRSLETAERCGKVISSKLTQDDIDDLLDAHNEYRALVASGEELRGNPGPQPAATNLKALKWDDELARLAQVWANQCIYKHDECNDLPDYQVGQNMARIRMRGYRRNVRLSEMVKRWYDEVAIFNRSYVKSVENLGNVGHYTQMVWAGTKLVGCSAIKFTDDSGWDMVVHLICNYGPAGNMPWSEVYKTR